METISSYSDMLSEWIFLLGVANCSWEPSHKHNRAAFFNFRPQVANPDPISWGNWPLVVTMSSLCCLNVVSMSSLCHLYCRYFVQLAAAWTSTHTSSLTMLSLCHLYVVSRYSLCHLYVVSMSSLCCLYVISKSSLSHLYVVSMSSLSHLYVIYILSLYHLYVLFKSSLYHLYVVTMLFYLNLKKKQMYLLCILECSDHF